MKHRAIILLISFCVTTTVVGQSKTDCFKIKYLNFFGYEDDLDTSIFKIRKWQESDLDSLLEMDLTVLGNKKYPKTSNAIPSIVFQLKDYYPGCSDSTNTEIFRKLKKLYYKIRKKDISTLDNESIPRQLEIIREDFYSQVQDESLLLCFNSWDDGPLYGQLSQEIPDFKKGRLYKTEFGTLYITNNSEKIYITVLDNEGKHLWTRLMTGVYNDILPDMEFDEKDIIKTSFGYVLLMYSDGEKLSLYLTTDGDFRFYFHSW